MAKSEIQTKKYSEMTKKELMQKKEALKAQYKK